MGEAVLRRRNRKVGLMAFGLAAAMVGLGFASVPLYRLFCQVTGFGGTTMRLSEAEAAQIKSAGRTISVRFDSSVANDLKWTFHPERSTETVTIGERELAVYVARNDSDETITGVATFNVEPEYTGRYFNKVQCFCFSQQTLKPGEEVRMPVIYYVDPRILEDENARDVEQITLSYTFHKSKQPVS